MPRFLVERTFPAGSHRGADALSAQAGGGAIDAGAKPGVTWIHSCVTPDNHRSYCIVDGPSPEAIRVAAQSTGLPVDRISEVQLLDPCPTSWKEPR
jgi:hypothetical protein